MRKSVWANSVIMLSDEFPEYGGKAPQTLGGSPVSIHLYVDDVDAFFKQALAVGDSTIYCGTSTAIGLLKRNKWQFIERVRYNGEDVSIYQKVL